ncbi:MAG TPA: sialidase family protein [Bryobacteraceae bacterium]|nr:sialidase family protein [Bryobacteraceae bacterium]
MGETWEQVSSLTLHPTREKWSPGAGGMCLHSIQCPGNGRLIAAISAAGAFRSFDNGATWEPFNGNVRCDFRPDKFPEVGQCVHKLLAHPRDPETLYQQNHCGVYRGKLTAKKWTDITRGLPTRFGFGLAVPAAEPETLFTVPIEGAEYRCNMRSGKVRTTP